jgi:hypothetical protein
MRLPYFISYFGDRTLAVDHESAGVTLYTRMRAQIFEFVMSTQIVLSTGHLEIASTVTDGRPLAKPPQR